MGQFEAGDIPSACRFLIANDPNGLVGTWEEMKKISQPPGIVLYKAGVGFIERQAVAVVPVQTDV